MGRLTHLAPRVSTAPLRVGYTQREPQGPASAHSSAPWRRLYNTPRWRKLRLKIFLRDRHTCRMCGRLQGDISKLVCDHVRPHRGNDALFWADTNLQTLCKSPCHDQHKQRLEQESKHQAGVWD